MHLKVLTGCLALNFHTWLIFSLLKQPWPLVVASYIFTSCKEGDIFLLEGCHRTSITVSEIQTNIRLIFLIRPSLFWNYLKIAGKSGLTSTEGWWDEGSICKEAVLQCIPGSEISLIQRRAQVNVGTLLPIGNMCYNMASITYINTWQWYAWKGGRWGVLTAE